MMQNRQGSAMILLVMLISFCTVFLSIIIVSAQYGRRIAYERLWGEQNKAALNAFLTYAVYWVKANRTLLKTESPWQIVFDKVPISHFQKRQITIDVQTQGNLDILCRVKLHDGIKDGSHASCIVTVHDTKNMVTVREWSVSLRV